MRCFPLIVNDTQCTYNTIYFPICSCGLSHLEPFMMKLLFNTYILESLLWIKKNKTEFNEFSMQQLTTNETKLIMPAFPVETA